jgi:hypothetical protein
VKTYKKYFIKTIQDTYPETYPIIIDQVNIHYTAISQDIQFSLTSRNPIDRRLDFCAYFLALIKTLDQQGETFEDIRKICLEVVTAYVQPKNRLQRYGKRLFPKLTTTWLGKNFIKVFHKRVSVNSNQDGFIANIITDKEETFGLGYGIDILECGICKLFNKHHYEKFAPILCEVDEITSGLAGLKLIRTGTIANGATKCDFRFKRVV